jgi:lauroyl/myristoyl acyltransferase
MSQKGNGGASSGQSRRPGTVLLAPVSAFLASVFCLLGIRRRVIRRNLVLVSMAPGPLFRWTLAYNAAQAVLRLLAPWSYPSPRASVRTRARVETLRAGSSMLLTAHFREWEAQAADWVRLGVPLLGAARPLKGAVAQSLLLRARKRHGIAVVTDAVPRRALRHLRGGGCFGLLWDQHAPDSRIPGRFFGCSVTLDPLPFFLLERVPCPVWFGVRMEDGTLRLVKLLDRFASGWELRLQRRYHRVLELLVRREPAHWYGFLHARFKNLGTYEGHREILNFP